LRDIRELLRIIFPKQGRRGHQMSNNED